MDRFVNAYLISKGVADSVPPERPPQNDIELPSSASPSDQQAEPDAENDFSKRENPEGIPKDIDEGCCYS